MDKCQIYAKALNVFSIDKIKYFNCEDIALGYPDLFSVYVGLNINFKQDENYAKHKEIHDNGLCIAFVERV